MPGMGTWRLIDGVEFVWPECRLVGTIPQRLNNFGWSPEAIFNACGAKVGVEMVDIVTELFFLRHI
jgi:hypothetical protein